MPGGLWPLTGPKRTLGGTGYATVQLTDSGHWDTAREKGHFHRTAL